MKRAAAWLVLLALAGCGSNSGALPDYQDAKRTCAPQGVDEYTQDNANATTRFTCKR